MMKWIVALVVFVVVGIAGALGYNALFANDTATVVEPMIEEAAPVEDAVEETVEE